MGQGGNSPKACCWSYSTFCKQLGLLEQGLDTEALSSWVGIESIKLGIFGCLASVTVS